MYYNKDTSVFETIFKYNLFKRNSLLSLISFIFANSDLIVYFKILTINYTPR